MGHVLYAIAQVKRDTGEAEFIKFGVTRDEHKRLSQLQTGNAHKLILLKTVSITERDAAYYHEKNIHYRLRNFRERGEWFKATPQVLDTVDYLVEDIYEVAV